jgi:hypothetical protein
MGITENCRNHLRSSTAAATKIYNIILADSSLEQNSL